MLPSEAFCNFHCFRITNLRSQRPATQNGFKFLLFSCEPRFCLANCFAHVVYGQFGVNQCLTHGTGHTTTLFWGNSG